VTTAKPPAPKPHRLTTAPNGADLLFIVGFVALVAGIALLGGPAWALVVAGGLLLSVGIVAAWRRS